MLHDRNIQTRLLQFIILSMVILFGNIVGNINGNKYIMAINNINGNGNK